MSEIDRRIGENLWAARIAAALPLDSLAGMMGISADALAEAEAGDRRLTAAEIQSAVTSLDVPVSRLFVGVSQAVSRPHLHVVLD